MLLGLLELLSDPRADIAGSPELAELRERWQNRLGTRMSEAITGLSPDGFERERAAGD